MLDELTKEMCADTIERLDPEYITVDNTDNNGRTVADCKIGIGDRDATYLGFCSLGNIAPVIIGGFTCCPYCGRRLPVSQVRDEINIPL